MVPVDTIRTIHRLRHCKFDNESTCEDTLFNRKKVIETRKCGVPSKKCCQEREEGEGATRVKKEGKGGYQYTTRML